MEQPNRSRRGLLAAAAVLPIAALPLPALTASGSIAGMWAEAHAIDLYLRATYDGTEPAGMLTRMFALEDAVLVGPIQTKSDAVAKLQAAALTFERGERTDRADVAAFEDAILWLETH